METEDYDKFQILVKEGSLMLTELYFQQKEVSTFKKTLEECLADENQKVAEFSEFYASYFKLHNVKFLNGAYFKDYDHFERFQNIPEKYFFTNNRYYYFISHRWLSIVNPDPDKEQFAIIREFIDKLPPEDRDECGFWYDYSCIPQKDAYGNITKEDQETYNQAIRMMHLLPMLSLTLMLIDPPYLTRAWCTMEWMCATRIAPVLAGGLKEFPFGNIVKFRHLMLLVLFLVKDQKFKESLISGEDGLAISHLNALVFNSIGGCASTIPNDKNILTALMYEHFENHLRIFGLRSQLMIAFLILERYDERIIRILFTQFLIFSGDPELKWTNQSMFITEALIAGSLPPTDMIFHRGKVEVKSTSISKNDKD